MMKKGIYEAVVQVRVSNTCHGLLVWSTVGGREMGDGFR